MRKGLNFPRKKINLMITYDCNRNCDFCFARGQRKIYPQEMSLRDILLILDWLDRQEIKRVSLLGGEPTLHSQFTDIVNLLIQKRFKVALFTNGIFNEKILEKIESLPPISIIVNYNPPEQYTKREKKILEKNLLTLSETRPKHNLTLRLNITSLEFRYDYLLEACERFNVPTVSYDIIHPTLNRDNIYLDIKKAKEKRIPFIEFLKECKKRNIKPKLDCPIPFCLLGEESLEFIRKEDKLIGRCWGTIDVNPDLTVYHCLPMSNLKTTKKIIEYKDLEELKNHFLSKTEKLRWNTYTFPECKSCQYRLKKLCQGGCLSSKLNKKL